MSTKDDAIGKWLGILTLFIPKEHLTGKHTSCPLCGGSDRFRFDDKNGNGSYFCNSCGAGTGIHLLMQHQGITYPEAWKLVEGIIGTVKQEIKKEIDQFARVKEILSNCTEGGELVSKYLLSRGIPNAPESLLAGFYWLDGAKCQCMIAKAAKGSKIVGLHATFIKNNKKIARRMYAVEKNSMTGSAIRLTKLNGSDAIVIGEGIETVLSASMITGLPAWSAMDAGKLETVQIPEQIKRIVIAADKDSSFTGQASAFILAKRLKSTGKIVDVIMPDNFDEDFNEKIRKDR